MSHSAKITTEFVDNDTQAFIEALKELFGEVEYHENGERPRLWNGMDGAQQSAPLCEIIIRRKTIEKVMGKTALVNDLGFYRKDGKWAAWLDSGSGFGEWWDSNAKGIKQTFAENVIVNKATREGYHVDTRTRMANGRRKVTISKLSGRS